MRQKFSIASLLLATAAAMLVLGAAVARAADVEVKNPVPGRYTVQKGDTLWGIAGRFLKDPWRWPDIWRMNREEIRNPHLIYPGDVIVLDKVDGEWRMTLERPTTRLSPTVRVSPIDAQAIPSIPAGDIEPFLSRPLITGPEGLDKAAQVVAGRDARDIRAAGDVVYVIGTDEKGGDLWHIYRQGRNLMSVDGSELLGIEQRYLGTAKVERYGPVSTLRIVAANEEILVGDRLVPAPRGQLLSYVPHAPAQKVTGHIIAANNDATEAARGMIVTLDRGAREGLDIGTVLAIYRLTAPIPDPRPVDVPQVRDAFGVVPTYSLEKRPPLDIPDDRRGLLFVFRVFDRVSYALVVSTTDTVAVGDQVRNP